ncbi:MAG: hypothetical protein QN152_08215 [Armatimonadota bacterium]|nr:hypothetical protein [Armatimonadota bacterium]MDR7427431.1 hypothetical protein [Armatimonadota bacterium]MDR7463911.1 hypothetical protein [Armatimonadota bacterium]MDR7470745.1 hypothetical protein [Armatimonadota bacterium]MDR7475010.1 hypothetical protein [Armatimonadota bacterium]
MSARQLRRGPRGATLLEIVMALGLFALAVGGIYALVATGGKSARVTNDFLQTQAQLRAALDNVVDEIRWAQTVTAASGTSVTLLIPQNTPFSATSPYTVTFAYDAAARTMTRQVDPDAGGPGLPGPAEALAYSVVQEDGSPGVAFEYFDAGGTPLGATPPDVGAIARVRLTVTTTQNQVSRVFTSDAALRAR